MTDQLRSLIVETLYPVSAYELPNVCERYGLDAGDSQESMSSKRRYVGTRLSRLPNDKILQIAQQVVTDYPDDQLQAAIEQETLGDKRISDITRHRLTEALNGFDLGGRRDLLELLRAHYPEIDRTPSHYDVFECLSDDIHRHMVRNDDWTNAELLEKIGFLSCSQARLFGFLEALLDPIIRPDEVQQKALKAALDPILIRDGYVLTLGRPLSGYPTYQIVVAAAAGTAPADAIISDALISYDEEGVHRAWQKALERRKDDPEGAITAAKSLLETVCKYVIDEAQGSYGDNDDLPKLYATAAELLNLSPSQHSEKVFKSILGNCQSVVGNLAGIRNKLGDSHGQGRRGVKPSPRHAELAVNLAGAMATFLITTMLEKGIANASQVGLGD